MNKKQIFITLLIFLIAAIFRIAMLDKASGLWYDELVSYKQASQDSILQVILYTLNTDVHLPLYQVFLHIWCKIFTFSDIALRSFSALCGILTVITSFFAGKELKNIKTGIITASIFALNSFFINYSQEVRMYAFLILLATLNILFTIRIKNNPNNKYNYIFHTLTSAALVYTYTISFIYVLGLLFTLFVYMKTKLSRDYLKKYFISTASFLVFCIPLFLSLIFNYSKYTTEINGYYCDWSSLFVIIQNIYTPVLIGLGNNPQHYMAQLFSNPSILNILLIFIPIAIGLSSTIYTIKKDKFSFVIISGSLLFLLAEIIAFKFTNFKILSRYFSVGMPAILILFGYGLSLMNKKICYSVLSVFIAINLGYLIFSPNAAYKLERQGYKPLALFVNSLQPKKSDFIVVWNRKEILDKYTDTNANILSILKDFAYKSEIMLNNDVELKKLPIERRKELLKNYFLDNGIPYNTYILMSYILERMNNGDKFIITTNVSFDGYDKKNFKELIENNYSNTTLNDLLTIKSLTDIKLICDKNLNFVEKKTIGDFVVTVYKK